MRELPSGLVVPGFQLGDQLGEGSRGTVFSATGEDGASVALKFFDPEDEELFLRQLAIFSSLHHPNVLPVLAAGESRGLPWIATPLAAKGSLRDLIAGEEGLDETRVADIIAQAAAGVEAMHVNRIVHGHITTANVLVDQNDHVYVSEPIALELGRADLSPRTDIHDLGSVMFSALARGVPPPTDDASVRAYRPEVSTAADQVVRAALTGDPAEGFASAGEMQMAAESLTPQFELREQQRAIADQMLQEQRMSDLSAQRIMTEGIADSETLPPTTQKPHNGGSSDAPPGSGEDERRAYARLEAPWAVVAEEPFDVTVGLSPEPVEGVVSEAWTLPEEDFTLTIQLVAAGFTRTDGDGLLFKLDVAAADPYPAVTLRLAADRPDALPQERALQAIYSIDGRPVGVAIRRLNVLRDRDQPAAPIEPLEPGRVYTAPEGPRAPDLTVLVLEGKQEDDGSLMWTFQTGHADLQSLIPAKPIACDIGEEPAAFAARNAKSIMMQEGKPLLYREVEGIGMTVAENMPPEFWSLLGEVAQRTAGPPSILFLTADPYVPWELAVMEAPLDPALPPFLAAQARVGRWVAGHSKPPPPPVSTPAKTMAVVSGKYTATPRWQELKEAEAEAADLQVNFAATPVNADSVAVADCLDGTPPADVLHFAMHGNYDPSGMQDGLALVDDNMLGPNVVRTAKYKSPRFVFLNACQVGSADRVLGDYAGMAAAFLYSGAAGVVAPLWKIDDKLARKLAVDFYTAVFGGAAPADLLRRERASFKASLQPMSATYVAYQFYGHPDMTLER